MKQNRDILKDFIKEHSQQLNSYQMRDGDLERFTQKVENASLRKGRWSFLTQGRFIAATAAVCVIAAIFVIAGIRSTDNGREPERLEQAYIASLQLKAAQIIKANAENENLSEEDLANSMESLLNDPVLMSEQLSDELSPKEKIRILKEYYNQKMEGLGQFKTLLANAE